MLVIGRWILNTLKSWIERLLELPAVQSVFSKAGITSALEPSGRKASSLLAMVAYAFLALMLWLVIFRILQIRPIEELMERLIAVLPLILVAAVLVIIAAAVANFVADLVHHPVTARQRTEAWKPGIAIAVVHVALVPQSRRPFVHVVEPDVEPAPHTLVLGDHERASLRTPAVEHDPVCGP